MDHLQVQQYSIRSISVEKDDYKVIESNQGGQGPSLKIPDGALARKIEVRLKVIDYRKQLEHLKGNGAIAEIAKIIEGLRQIVNDRGYGGDDEKLKELNGIFDRLKSLDSDALKSCKEEIGFAMDHLIKVALGNKGIEEVELRFRLMQDVDKFKSGEKNTEVIGDLVGLKKDIESGVNSYDNLNAPVCKNNVKGVTRRGEW